MDISNEQSGQTGMEQDADVKLEEISSFLGVDISAVQRIDGAVLTSIADKANKFDSLKAENLKITVTLEEVKTNISQEKHACETKAQSLQKEVEKLRRDQADCERQQSTLMEEKASAINKTQTLTAQLKQLQSEKEVSDAGKNDVARLMNEKISDLAQAKQETENMLASNKDLRSQIVDLDAQVRVSKARELSQRAELQRATQESSLLKSNNDWLQSRLKSINEEFSNYRKESDQKVQEALRNAQKAQFEAQVSTSTLTTLREQYNEVSQMSERKSEKIKHLSDQANTDKQEFAREMALKQRLLELLENQVESLKKDLTTFESQRSLGVQDHKSEKEELLQQVKDAQVKLDASEVKIERLESTVEELLSMNQQSARSASPSVLKQKSSSNSHGSYDLTVIKKQLIHERRQKEALQNQVEAFIIELEHKAPVLNSFKERNEMLEEELTETALMLESITTVKENCERDLHRCKSKLRDYEAQVSSLVKQRSDLASQVQYLIIQASLYSNSELLLSPEEVSFIKKLQKSESHLAEQDSQKIITERLVKFKDVHELQTTNMNLLNSVRSLASKLEQNEKTAGKMAESIENATVAEAKEAILTLQDHNSKLEERLAVLSREKDALKKVVHTRNTSSIDNSIDKDEKPFNFASNDRIRELEAQITTLLQESQENYKLLNEETKSLHKKNSELLVSLERERSSKSLSDDRLALLKQKADFIQRDKEELSRRVEQLETSSGHQEENNQKILSELIECQGLLKTKELELKNRTAEIEMLRTFQQDLKTELQNLSREKNEMTILVTQLQALEKERTEIMASNEKSWKQQHSSLTTELSELKGTLKERSEELASVMAAKNSQTQWYQEKFDSISESNLSTQKECQAKTAALQALENEVKLLKGRLKDEEHNMLSFDHKFTTSEESSPEELLNFQLKEAKLRLKEAFSQVEEYQAIARTNEEALLQISSAFEESKAITNKTISDLELESATLKQKVLDLADEKQEVQRSWEAERKDYDSKSKQFKDEISNLENKLMSFESMKADCDAKLAKAQEDLAHQLNVIDLNRQIYEKEKVKYKDFDTDLDRAKEELNDARNKADVFRREAEIARTTIKEEEEAWNNQKSDYDAKLMFVNERNEDLATQNRLLCEQLDVMSKGTGAVEAEGTENLQSNQLVASLRRENDIVSAKLEITRREEKALRLKLQSSEAQLEVVRGELVRTQIMHYPESPSEREHEVIINELNQLNLFRESNVTLREQIKKHNDTIKELQTYIDTLEDKVVPLEKEIQSLHNNVAAKDRETTLLKEEAARWKQRSLDALRRDSHVDVSEHEKLTEELKELKESVKAKEAQNAELEDRFQRLKKQARERLDNAKVQQGNLNVQLEELKNNVQALESELHKERQLRTALEMEGSKHALESSDQDVRNELELAHQAIKETEIKLAEIQATGNATEKQLRKELEDARARLAAFQENASQDTIEDHLSAEASKEELNKALSELEATLKDQFAKEKESILSQQKEVLRKAFEEEKAEEMKRLESELNEKNNERIDIDAIKKQWEQAYEENTLKRIEEANKDLRKRIRLPTEDKINKIIEARKKELEDEYSRRVEEASKNASTSRPATAGFTELMKNHKQEVDKIRKELTEKFETEIRQVKKKAFDEGKQQAGMKSIFLEKKITKLEEQLKNASSNPLQAPVSRQASAGGTRPSKITEVQPLQESSEPSQPNIAPLPIKTLPFNENDADAKNEPSPTITSGTLSSAQPTADNGNGSPKRSAEAAGSINENQGNCFKKPKGPDSDASIE